MPLNIFMVFKKVFSITKKIFLVIVVYFVIISLFFYQSGRDKMKIAYDPIKENRKEIYKIINDPVLNKTKNGKIALLVYKKIVCGTIGEGCADNSEQTSNNFDKSLFGKLSYLITIPYANPPASGIYWASSGLENAGFIPQTYAAEGVGFAALKPFMNLWKIFRDLCYLILVLILVTIGFMIMFRMKLNPQTVITIESALPRIVVSMLLITFSFAIAGFLVDLMYVSILLIIAILSNRGNYFNTTEFQNIYVNASAGKIFAGLLPNGFFPSLWQISSALINIVPPIINQIVRSILGVVGSVLALHFLGNLVYSLTKWIGDLGASTMIAHTITTLIGWAFWGILILILVILGFVFGYSVLPIILFILIALTVLLMFFRIFFMLFAAYLKIFLLVVFSPFFMLFEALPSKSSAFAYWFKNLFVEVFTFVIVVLLFVLSYLVMNVSSNWGNSWRPPFLTDINPNSLNIMLGMGIVFMVPELVKLFKESLGVKGLPVSLDLGTFFAGAGAGVGGALGMSGQLSSLMLAFPGLRLGAANILGRISPKMGEFMKEGWTLPKAQPVKSPPTTVPPAGQNS